MKENKMLKVAENFKNKTPNRTIDFEDLVGRDGWARLPRVIRDRFGQAPATGEIRTYKGTMTRMDMTAIGKLLSILCIPLGRPLPGRAGTWIPALANVYTVDGGKGVMWERTFFFPALKPIVVKSMKKINQSRGMLEYTRAGLGMFLKVYEKNGILYFESTGYFFQIGKLFIPIPVVFTPGKALVGHEDKGNNYFEFTLTFTHPLFGRLFDQAGLFHPVGEK